MSRLIVLLGVCDVALLRGEHQVRAAVYEWLGKVQEACVEDGTVLHHAARNLRGFAGRGDGKGSGNLFRRE